MKTRNRLNCGLLLFVFCSLISQSCLRAEELGSVNQFTALPQEISTYRQSLTVKKFQTDFGYILVTPNIRPFPQTATNQIGIVASTMGGNQNEILAMWNSVDPVFYGTGYCLTTTGGLSWSGNYQTIVAGNNGFPGSWIWPAGSSYAGRLGLSVVGSSGISATYSNDNGASWNPFSNVGGATPDRGLACVDDVLGSPFFGRAYTVWTDFSGTYANRIAGAYSSNGGASWSGYQPVSPVPPSGHYMQGCDIAVGPGGVVYCVWATSVINGVNSTEDFLGFAKSTDGGVSWPVSNYNVVDINGIRAGYVFSYIQVNGWPRIAVDHSGGSRNGWIYTVLSEKFLAPARDSADITLCRSTDGGTTWTHTLVNSDTAGRSNFMSSVCVDQTNGNIAAGYYDMRNSTTPVEQYYVSVSNNGGNSWIDIQASDHNFTLIGYWWQSGFFGDHEGIVFSNGKILPFWMDNSTGKYNVWTCSINPQTLTHDWYCGPFVGLPSTILINTQFDVKAKITNTGSSNESSVPVKFFIDGILTNTVNRSLNAGQMDTVHYIWNLPSTAGTHQLMYVTALSTDQDRTNDTVRANVNVAAGYPNLCLFECSYPANYTPITGSPGPTGNDAGMTVPIGFNFNYVGTNYTQAWICTNGFIKMGPTGSTSPNNNLCTTDTSLTNIIAAFWDDLNTNVSGDIQYTTQGTAPNRKFIVQFTGVGYNGGSGNVTFQIILYETYNAIDIVYGAFGYSSTATATVGLNVAPGGPGNYQSIIPAITCGLSQVWTTSCYNSNQGNIAYGMHYHWCTGPYLETKTQSNKLPINYYLSQNYPNPFNPSTVINFGIPKAGNVRLVVYDLLGRFLTTLVDEFKQAGYYKVDFNGSSLSSGVYFYELEAGDFTLNKKMLLVK